MMKSLVAFFDTLKVAETILLFLVFLPLNWLLAGCSAQKSADLVISNARILQVKTGTVSEDRTLVISDGKIKAVLNDDRQTPKTARILDADGKLLTPGLIDVHGHLAYVLGDSVSRGGGYITHLERSPDSLTAYRQRYAKAYLPHGVTTVRDAGSTEKDLKLLSDWYKKPSPDLPDFYPSGGALISPMPEGRTPFPGHVVVADSNAARAKIRDYHNRGFKHIKLYWRLREPEFKAALDEAQQIGMNVTGHIDNHLLGIDKALDLGLRNYEHAYTVGKDAMTIPEYNATWRKHVPEVYGDRRRGLFHLGVTEFYNQLGPEDPDALALIERLAETGSTVSTSLHIFAQQVGAAPFVIRTGTMFDDVSGLTDEQRKRARKGYELLAGYVRRMHEAGVRLALAPDWMEPGRVALSEMLLLHKAGIPMTDIFKIATLNGARSIGLQDRGAIEPGMRADVVLWHENPLENPDGLFSEKTVINAGKMVELVNKSGF